MTTISTDPVARTEILARIRRASTDITNSDLLRGKKMGPVPVPVAERWLKYRDVDAPPADTFRTWWKKNRQEQR